MKTFRTRTASVSPRSEEKMAEQNKLSSPEIDNILDEIDEKEANAPKDDNDFFPHQVIRVDKNPWMPNRDVQNDWIAFTLNNATKTQMELAKKMTNEVCTNQLQKILLHVFL